MVMPDDQASPIRKFLSTWRREIIRGGVLFALVIAVGLAIQNMRAQFRAPWAALSSFSGFDIDPEGDLFGDGREVGPAWSWTGRVTRNQQVWIRNTNGPVSVVEGDGDELEVTAEKSWRHSQPDAVQLVPVTSERGVTICALWSARDQRCGEGGEYHMQEVHHNDVGVRFTVHLPRGVKVDVSTVNGEVAIDGAAAPVVANTMNGRILVHTSVGPVTAKTINGSVEASMDALTGGDVEMSSKNGSVTAVLPSHLNAVLDASTMNGRVDTDFPISVVGKMSPRHLRGTIGTGGMTLKLSTLNGSVTLRRSDDSPETAAPPARVRAERRPRHPTPPATPTPDKP